MIKSLFGEDYSLQVTSQGDNRFMDYVSGHMTTLNLFILWQQWLGGGRELLKVIFESFVLGILGHFSPQGLFLF